MASWRESDDPRCPACGEKITATADYCMHCAADFAEDGSVIDPSGTGQTPDDPRGEPSEDVGDTWGTVDDSGVGTGADLPSDHGAYDDGSSDDSVRDDTTFTDTSRDDTHAPEARGDDTVSATGDSVDAESILASVQSALKTGSVRSDVVESTTLLLRAPISVVMAFPAAVILALVLTILLPGRLGTWLFLGSWALGTAFLLQRPLASDAIGDAFYLYALVLVAAPILGLVRSFVVAAIFGGVDLESVVVLVVVFEIVLLLPVGFFLAIGFGCNYYARSKVESALGEQQSG